MLVASAVLARSGQPARNAAVLFGALLPDLSIFALFAWARLQDIPQWQIWRQLYWQEPWQLLSAISNSFPIWAAVLVIGLALRSGLLAAIAAAALLHLTLDFPVHADDAHKHFWPITDWRFHSPLSYWDVDHHGRLVMAAELLLCIACTAVLASRFSGVIVRSLLVIALLSLAAVPMFFWLTLG